MSEFRLKTGLNEFYPLIDPFFTLERRLTGRIWVRLCKRFKRQDMQKSTRASRHARIKEAILVTLLVLGLIFILSFIP
jgi:hypothetical protein